MKIMLRPCDGCGSRCHPDDLMTRDVENYGGHETIELCERCDTTPEPVGIDGIDFDALNLDANAGSDAPGAVEKP